MCIDNIDSFNKSFEDGCFDDLIVILTDIFIKRLKNHSVFVEFDFDRYENKLSYQLLKLGCECINAGVFPECIVLLLDYKMSEFLNIGNLKYNDIMELSIVKHLIPLIQKNDLDAFSSITQMFIYDTRKIADISNML